MTKWISALGLVAMASGFAAERESVETLFSAELRAAIQYAKSIETFRLSGDSARDGDPANWKKGPVWERERVRDVAALMLSDNSYVFYFVKPCKPRPGVLLRLKSGANTVDVRLCFECGVMEVSCAELKFSRWMHFEPSRATWAHWAKEAFADDVAIQGLKEKSMPREEVERIQNEALRMRRELEEKKAPQDGEKK